MKLYDYSTGKLEPSELKSLIEDNWEEGIRVVFTKKGGSVRKMVVKLDGATLAPKADVSKRDGVESRRKTNKAHGNMVVTELLEDGSYQIRTICLNNVMTVETV